MSAGGTARGLRGNPQKDQGRIWGPRGRRSRKGKEGESAQKQNMGSESPEWREDEAFKFL